MSDIGDKIKYLRSLHQLSQEELGERIGVQRAAINKYEVGTVVNIPLRTIEKLSEVLNVSPTYLVGWDEATTQQLSEEVKIINGVKHFYGSQAVDLLESYVSLNDVGKERLFQYTSDLERLYSNASEHCEV